jgi:hypothetical protein
MTPTDQKSMRTAAQALQDADYRKRANEMARG